MQVYITLYLLFKSLTDSHSQSRYYVHLRNVRTTGSSNVNAKRWATPSALFRASCDGDVEALKALIHNGANVNAVNAVNGVKQTALHHAAQNGHVDVAKVLIQNGADVNANQLPDGLHFLHSSP